MTNKLGMMIDVYAPSMPFIFFVEKILDDRLVLVFVPKMDTFAYKSSLRAFRLPKFSEDVMGYYLASCIFLVL